VLPVPDVLETVTAVPDADGFEIADPPVSNANTAAVASPSHERDIGRRD
jgi:hypothetical protein